MARTDGLHPAAATGFARSAEAYERGRPGYPPDAIAFLVERLGLEPGRVVLDLAAGTGKLTRLLAASGARVVAVEPIEEMRAVLERAVPAAEAVAGTAEAIPLADGSVDAVTVAQAFHWFDGPRALAEIRRVLEPEGSLAVVWNQRDFADPLQEAIDAVLEPHRRAGAVYKRGEWRAAFPPDALEKHVFHWSQSVDHAQLEDRFASVSVVAALPPGEREELLARIRALAAGHAEPIELPYETQIFLARRSDILDGR